MDPIRLGYACINTHLREQGIFCSRTCVTATLLEMTPARAADHCRDLARKNLADLLRTLEWNEAHGIRVFRITSTLFPHCGNHLLPAAYQRQAYFQGDVSFARPELAAVGQFVREYGHRISWHAQPYLQLGTPVAEVLERTRFDLMVHIRMIRIMRLPEDPIIILHGGGFYPEGHVDKAAAKRATLQRWIAEWRRLPLDLRRCITLENDERHYGVADLLPVCEQYGIRFCLDVFHNQISADRVDITPALMRRVVATWHGVRPKFHLSDQWPGQAFGAHAQYVRAIPDYLMRMRGIDIMIEAKMKERAVLRLYKKQFMQVPGTRWRPRREKFDA